MNFENNRIVKIIKVMFSIVQLILQQ